METHRGRLQKLRSPARLLAALSFLIVLISAYIRLSGAGFGCMDWPGCYGHLLVGGPHPHTGTVRILHRLIAALLLLLGFYIAWRCLRPTPIQPVARYATLLLALMILLTLVGLWSSDAHRVWASSFNMLGGAALVSLSWRMVLEADPVVSAPRTAGSSNLMLVGLAALVLAIAFGVLIGARYAAISCTSTPSCAGVWWPTAVSWATLSPFTNIATPSLPGDAEGVTLHLLHRYCAAAAMLLMGAAGLQSLAANDTRNTAQWLLVLLALEFVLGSLTVVSGFSLWLGIGHSVCAAALLAVSTQLLNEIMVGGRAR
jgi:heme A synthase